MPIFPPFPRNRFPIPTSRIRFPIPTLRIPMTLDDALEASGKRNGKHADQKKIRDLIFLRPRIHCRVEIGKRGLVEYPIVPISNDGERISRNCVVKIIARGLKHDSTPFERSIGGVRSFVLEPDKSRRLSPWLPMNTTSIQVKAFDPLHDPLTSLAAAGFESPLNHTFFKNYNRKRAFRTGGIISYDHKNGPMSERFDDPFDAWNKDANTAEYFLTLKGWVKGADEICVKYNSSSRGLPSMRTIHLRPGDQWQYLNGQVDLPNDASEITLEILGDNNHTCCSPIQCTLSQRQVGSFYCYGMPLLNLPPHPFGRTVRT